MHEDELMSSIRKFVLVLGSALVLIGAMLMIYFGVIVCRVVQRPNDVPLVQYAMDRIASGDRTVYGNVGKDTIDISVSESTRAAAFLFIGVISLAILARVIRAIISGGLEMVWFGLGRGKHQAGEAGEPHAGVARERV
jgi:hypothetical protein